MTLIKFNDEMIMRFIRAYKAASCLWDIRLPGYRDRKQRSAMYQYLADVMNIPGFTVNDVKNKIKNIRSTYCQELKKIQQHKTLGLEPYVPTNVWFAEFDEFMSSNIIQRDTQQTNYMMMSYPMGECVLTEVQGNSMLPCLAANINGDAATDFGSEDVSQMNDSSYGAPTNGIQPVEAVLRRLEKLSESLVRKDEQHKEDEFDCFGKSVAQQLRKLPLISAMRLKIKIQVLLSEERINCLGGNGKEISENPDDGGVTAMEDGEQNQEQTTENNDENRMQEGEESAENFVGNTDMITNNEEGNRNNAEKVGENIIEITDEEEEEERPSSRASALSLHVSCSSDEESETEH